MKLEMSVEIKGKLFDLKAKPIVDAVQRSIQTLVENGSWKLAEMLTARPKGVFLSVAEAQKGKATQGHYSRSVADNVRIEELHGRISDGGVIYSAWLEGVSSRNQTTRFKGYHSFRLTAQELQKQAPEVLRKNLDQAMKELNQ